MCSLPRLQAIIVRCMRCNRELTSHILHFISYISYYDYDAAKRIWKDEH